MKSNIYKVIYAVAALILFSGFASAQRPTIQELYSQGEYRELADLITRSGKPEQLSAKKLEMLAYSYTSLGNYKEAEAALKELVSREPDKAEYNLQYADILFAGGKLDTAKDRYKIYLERKPDDLYAKVKLMSCDSLIKWDTLNNQKVIRSLSDTEEYTDKSGDLFRKARFLKLPARSDTTNGNDSLLTLVKKPWLTSDYFCSSVDYDENRQRMAYSVREKKQDFNRTYYSKSKIVFDSPDNKEADNLVVFEWEGMPENINVAHPAFGQQGNRLYFTCDMTGGKGGTDLYYSDYKNGAWQVPVNLGYTINTAFNEVSPALAGDTLFYATDGLPGYGRLDLYYTILSDTGFSKPVNLKAPANSLGNDLFYKPFNGDEAILSSDRAAPEEGELEVYSLITIQPELPQDSADDRQKEEPAFDLEAYELPLVFFETDTDKVAERYMSTLRDLADTLKKYDKLRLKITAYTDITGSEEYNDNLSQDRAKAVQDSLLQLGAPAEQINYKAGGEASDSALNQVRYHVFVGTSVSENEHAWYAQRLKNMYEVKSLENGKFYSYYVGNFVSPQKALTLAESLPEKYNISSVVGATYKGVFLPNFTLALNRRAEFELLKQKK